jgi:hypothetical protein
MAKLVDLQNLVVNSFNLDELNQLCFALNIDYEELPSKTKSGKVRDLLGYLSRRNQVSNLLDYCVQNRPSVQWPSISSIEPMTSIAVADRDSATLSPEQTRLFLEMMGIPANLKRNKYADTQLTVYDEIWKSLFSLKLAGDDLWESASYDNIIKFSQVLNDVTHMVEEKAIFLVENDYEELKRLLNIFSAYRLGKLRLYEIRQYDIHQVVDYVPEDMAQRQIQENRRHKEEYEVVLESVKVSFRTRLSAG